MQNLLRLLALILLLSLAACAMAAELQPASPFSQMPASESGPGQSPADIARRIAWSRRNAEAWKEYQTGNERFGVYVPPTTTKAGPAGLMVFIWPGRQIGLPPEWREVLDRERLIYICPENAGNDRDPILRMALALDAVWNARRHYAIDQNRILISGLSGGGRVTSMLIVVFPEVFTGAIPIIGCDYYRDVRSARQAGYYRRGYLPPPAGILAMARLRPIAILEGENDANQDQSLVYSRAMKADGFRHVTYLEVPGMGHTVPPGRWFAEAITAVTAVPTTQPAAARPLP